ncbi:hypothetical protein PRIPAC_80490, partial [Pristionchus pacificus]|uniref:G protein-coupled receptor n=1 Tax=Pristionchus pacificus TaxID=54126 RepID=A0A2A6CP89_PRIPA
VLRELRFRASTISEKKMKMHMLLIKILTLHAASPLFVTFGIIGMVAMIFGYHHPELKTIIFMAPSFPTVINQAVSLWFLKPYQAFVQDLKKIDLPNNAQIRAFA